MAEQSEARGAWGFRAGMFIGAALGMAAGLLLAPRPGRQTREGLLDQAELLRSKGLTASLQEQVSGLQHNLNDVRDVLREAVAELREVVREAIAEGKRADAEAQEALRREYQESLSKRPADKDKK